MPKVNEAYFINKKNEILDAAFSVCMDKHVCDVIMSDIVARSGLSQGGVYKYFSNIDDVFIALSNRMNEDSGVIEEVDRILCSGKRPESVVEEVFDLAARKMLSTVKGFGKISFELDAMYANYPERDAYFRSQVKEASDYDYLIKNFFDYIQQQVDSGYFNPDQPVHDIFMFIVAAFDGIRRDVTLSNCYPSQLDTPIRFHFDGERLMKILFSSTLMLLRGTAKAVAET